SSQLPSHHYLRLLSPFLTLFPPPHSPSLLPYTTLFRSMVFPAVATSTDPRSINLTDSLIKPSISFAAWALRLASVRTSLATTARSEEHTSELQSRFELVCRLLLEKKKMYYSAFNIQL